MNSLYLSFITAFYEPINSKTSNHCIQENEIKFGGNKLFTACRFYNSSKGETDFYSKHIWFGSNHAL